MALWMWMGLSAMVANVSLSAERVATGATGVVEHVQTFVHIPLNVVRETIQNSVLVLHDARDAAVGVTYARLIVLTPAKVARLAVREARPLSVVMMRSAIAQHVFR